MWHIPTDVYTTHKSSFMWIHYIYTPWCIHSICTMEDMLCIRGAAYAEQYYDPSCVYDYIYPISLKWGILRPRRDEPVDYF